MAIMTTADAYFKIDYAFLAGDIDALLSEILDQVTDPKEPQTQQHEEETTPPA